jgi:hypothetical protein
MFKSIIGFIVGVAFGALGLAALAYRAELESQGRELV